MRPSLSYNREDNGPAATEGPGRQPSPVLLMSRARPSAGSRLCGVGLPPDVALTQTRSLHPSKPGWRASPSLGTRPPPARGQRNAPSSPWGPSRPETSNQPLRGQFCGAALGFGGPPGSGQAPVATAGGGDQKPPAGKIREPSCLRTEI